MNHASERVSINEFELLFENTCHSQANFESTQAGQICSYLLTGCITGGFGIDGFVLAGAQYPYG